MYRLSNEQIEIFVKQNSLAAFYKAVADACGLAVRETDMFNCDKIAISSNILDKWELQFVEQYGEGATNELYMHLLNLGPKVDSSLAEDEVSISDGFVFTPEEIENSVEEEDAD